MMYRTPDFEKYRFNLKRSRMGIPHIWFRRGNWHCAVVAVWCAHVNLWPRGVGDTPRAAFIDYEKRAKEWK